MVLLGDLVESLADILLTITCFANCKAAHCKLVNAFLTPFAHVIHDVKPFLLQSDRTPVLEVEMLLMQFVKISRTDGISCFAHIMASLLVDLENTFESSVCLSEICISHEVDGAIMWRKTEVPVDPWICL